MNIEPHLSYEFVEYIPDKLRDRTVYISVKYKTVVHKCCCGCGFEVVTPLSPSGWKLTYDGQSISLEPSIGNWSFPCQSHYWITHNTVKWVRRLSQDESGRKEPDERREKRNTKKWSTFTKYFGKHKEDGR